MSVVKHVNHRLAEVVRDNGPIVIFCFAALVTAGVVIGFRSFLDSSNVIAELLGFTLDIILFGLVLSIYDRWNQKRARVRELQDQIKALNTWSDEEGVLRKVWAIRQLNEVGARLPSMDDIRLPRAHLHNADLRGALLLGANLEEANLSGANLRGANLCGANLAKSEGLSWEDLQEAITDENTCLPMYLADKSPDWYSGEFGPRAGVW